MTMPDNTVDEVEEPFDLISGTQKHGYISSG